VLVVVEPERYDACEEIFVALEVCVCLLEEVKDVLFLDLEEELVYHLLLQIYLDFDVDLNALGYDQQAMSSAKTALVVIEPEP
jgi:hypothetical protein